MKSHFLAACVGLFLGLICSPLAIGGFPPYIVLIAPIWGVGFYAIPTVLGIVLLRWLADRLGRYEAFTILAGVMALAVSFGWSYVSSLDSWLTSRGEMHGTILGAGPPPEDIGDHLLVLGSLGAWIALLVVGALKWKHLRLGPPDKLESPKKALVHGYLALDSILIAVITVTILDLCLMQRREWSDPNQVLARYIGVLDDEGSSAGDRALALHTIGRSRDPRVIEVLRREARDGTGENHLSAAVSLLGIDDKLALAVLEKPLMQSGTINGSIQPTTSHTPSDGLGVRVAGFGTIGTWQYGRAVENVRDPATVPVLVRLMGAPDTATREGAASALRSILILKRAGGSDRWKPGWPSTIDVPTVTDAMIRALDDPDEMVRYFAVCVLMEATGNPHFPSVDRFKRNEQDDLEQWKKWALSSKPPQ